MKSETQEWLAVSFVTVVLGLAILATVKVVSDLDATYENNYRNLTEPVCTAAHLNYSQGKCFNISSFEITYYDFRFVDNATYLERRTPGGRS